VKRCLVRRALHGKVAVVSIALSVVATSGVLGFDPLATDHCIDFIVLSHDDFAADAIAFLDDPDLRGCVVTTSEILGAFGGGADTLTVDHLRSFVEFAHASWRIAPRHLLLVGDACDADPAYDFIPSHMRVNEWWQEEGWPCTTYCWEFADDGHLVRGIGDEKKPVMHVGRIPCRTAEELGRPVKSRFICVNVAGRF